MPRHANHSNRTWRNATRVADSPTTCAKSGAASGRYRRTRRDLSVGAYRAAAGCTDSRQAPRVLDQPAGGARDGGGHDPVGRHERRRAARASTLVTRHARCSEHSCPDGRHASATLPTPPPSKTLTNICGLPMRTTSRPSPNSRRFVAPNQAALDRPWRPRCREHGDHRFGHRESRAAIQSQPTSQLAQTSLFECAAAESGRCSKTTIALINVMRKGRPGGRGQTHRGPQQNVTR